MDYNKIITESIQIFWRNKSLWLVGMVAAFFGQGNGNYNFNFNYQQPFPGSSNKNPFSDFKIPSFVHDIINNPIPYIVAVVVIILGWWLLATLLGWLAQGALIGMVDEADRTGATSLGQGWQVGSERLIHLVLIAVLLALPTLLMLIPMAIWAISLITQIGVMATHKVPTDKIASAILPLFFSTIACLIPIICIGGLLNFGLNLLKIISMRSCVLEQLGAIDSIKRGWQVVRQNIGYTLLTWFLLLIGSSIFSFIVFIPMAILGIPIITSVIYQGWSSFSIGLVLMFVLVMIVVSTGIGGLVTSFNSTLWTKFYKEVARD